jgi:PKD domain
MFKPCIVQSAVALCLAAAGAVAGAQTIETFAGNGSSGPYIATGPALTTAVPNVQDVAIAPDGTVYLVDGARVRLIRANGNLETVPGTGPRFGPGGVATNLQAGDIAIDASGRVFVTDGSRFQVFEMSAALAFNPIIGLETPGYSGDGGPANVAQLSGVVGLDIDAAGNLYVAEPNRVRKVTPDGIISTAASSSFGGPPGQFRMTNMAVDGDGAAYTWFPNPPLGLWKSNAAGEFERVNPSASIIQRCVNGPVATQAVFGPPRSGPDGLIYIANDSCVSRLTPGGQLINVAGSAAPGTSIDPGPLAQARFQGITSLAFDASNRLYIGDARNFRVRRASGIPAFANSAPVANAGSDQQVVVGDVVTLDGRASADPDADALQYTWNFTAQPSGSATTLTHPSTAQPQFVADAAGDYAVRLEVSDGNATSTDDLSVSVQTFAEFASGALGAARQSLAATPTAALDAPGHHVALDNLLGQAAAAIEAGDLGLARQKLVDALERLDGCFLRGTPDSHGQGSDWIVDCGYQTDPYFWISSVLARLP